MKVLQINAVSDFGSTGRIVIDLSERMNEINIENYIAYSEGETLKANVYKIGNMCDHKLHAVLSRIFGLQGYFSKYHTKKLLKWIDKIHPDVIHLHNLHANYINLPLLFSYISSKRIATVITLHDCFFFTGKCTHYYIAGCYKWKDECGGCPQLKNGNESWFFDCTRRMIRDRREWYRKNQRLGVIGVSKWITSEAKQSVLANAKIIRTIYNWIDLTTFYPHESNIYSTLGIKSKYVVLGVAIKWTREKGVDDYNKLAELLDEDYSIVLVGGGEIPLHERIIHIDRTNDIKMLSDMYASADVFFNPTKRETFGKVTAEALACGTPVIVYDTTACTELVQKDCGVVEEMGNIQSVCNNIKKIAEKRDEYTKACRMFAEENFDKRKKIDETISLYGELFKQD